MTQRQNKYWRLARINAFVMILVLSWLTISLPVVYAHKNSVSEKISLDKVSGVLDVAEEIPQEESKPKNPFAGSTEEKVPNLSEEYLHNSEEYFYMVEICLNQHKVYEVKEYTAFHGELLCPPPNSI